MSSPLPKPLENPSPSSAYASREMASTADVCELSAHAGPSFPAPTPTPAHPDRRFLCLRRLVKFQRVSVLTIFVADNVGDTESTVIEKLAILGSSGDSFNVAEIKDVSKEQG